MAVSVSSGLAVEICVIVEVDVLIEAVSGTETHGVASSGEVVSGIETGDEIGVETRSVVAVELGPVTIVGVETRSVVTVELGPVTIVGVETRSVVTVELGPVTVVSEVTGIEISQEDPSQASGGTVAVTISVEIVLTDEPGVPVTVEDGLMDEPGVPVTVEDVIADCEQSAPV